LTLNPDRTKDRLNSKQDVEQLIELLANANQEIKISAIEALVSIGEVAIIPLIKVLNDTYRWFAAADALVKIGQPALSPLIEALGDMDRSNFAFKALIELGKLAVAPLIDAFNSENVERRSWAVLAFRYINDERAVVPLIKALKDEDEVTRKNAAEALGTIGNDISLPALLYLELNDTDEYVRNAAAEAIKNFKRF